MEKNLNKVIKNNLEEKLIRLTERRNTVMNELEWNEKSQVLTNLKNKLDAKIIEVCTEIKEMEEKEGKKEMNKKSYVFKKGTNNRSVLKSRCTAKQIKKDRSADEIKLNKKDIEFLISIGCEDKIKPADMENIGIEAQVQLDAYISHIADARHKNWFNYLNSQGGYVNNSTTRKLAKLMKEAQSISYKIHNMMMDKYNVYKSLYSGAEITMWDIRKNKGSIEDYRKYKELSYHFKDLMDRMKKEVKYTALSPSDRMFGSAKIYV